MKSYPFRCFSLIILFLLTLAASILTDSAMVGLAAFALLIPLAMVINTENKRMEREADKSKETTQRSDQPVCPKCGGQVFNNKALIQAFELAVDYGQNKLSWSENGTVLHFADGSQVTLSVCDSCAVRAIHNHCRAISAA